MQRLGDAAHADAADADEMHDPDGLRHLHEPDPSLNCPTETPEAIASVRSASNRVASVRPTLFAASAIAASRAPSPRSPANSPPNAAISISFCRRSKAAPASARMPALCP